LRLPKDHITAEDHGAYVPTEASLIHATAALSPVTSGAAKSLVTMVGS